MRGEIQFYRSVDRRRVFVMLRQASVGSGFEKDEILRGAQNDNKDEILREAQNDNKETMTEKRGKLIWEVRM